MITNPSFQLIDLPENRLLHVPGVSADQSYDMMKKQSLVSQLGSEVFLAAYSRFGSNIADKAVRIPVPVGANLPQTVLALQNLRKEVALHGVLKHVSRLPPYHYELRVFIAV